ncbi:MAG: hypothetical protein ACI4JY_01295 [Oscillospiraceae bacterium]
MKRRTIFTAAVIAAMLALSGCNNSEKPTQSEQSSQTVEENSSSVQSSTSTESSGSAESSSSTESSASTESSGSTESSSSTESSNSTESSSSTESSGESKPETPTDDKPVTVADLALKDGEYTVAVNLEGGSGKVKATSPTKLIVKDGAASAEIELSSKNYDYMKVDGVKYDRTNAEGNSKFLIPVAGFDYKMPISANTTAMGNPHEIEYTLFFDSTTIS